MSFRKTIKRLGRKTAAISAKVNRVAVPVVAAGASYFGSPILGEAVAYGGSWAGRYFASTDARNRGIQGQRARDFGRKEFHREFMYSQIGVGAGMVGSGITAALQGGSLLQSIGTGLAGQGGSQVLGIGPTIYSGAAQSNISGLITPAMLAAQKSSAVPGLVTQADLAASLASSPATAGSAAATASTATTLLTAATGIAGKLLDPSKSGSAGTVAGSNRFNPLDFGGGGGSDGGGGFGLHAPGAGGDGSLLIPALVIGGVLLLASMG